MSHGQEYEDTKGEIGIRKWSKEKRQMDKQWFAKHYEEN